MQCSTYYLLYFVVMCPLYTIFTPLRLLPLKYFAIILVPNFSFGRDRGRGSLCVPVKHVWFLLLVFHMLLDAGGGRPAGLPGIIHSK